MRFNRARYITVCQQFLVTAVVVAVGLSAAGVMTLQIVSPEAAAPEALDLAPAIEVGDAYVAESPVTPQVREVKVAPLRATAQKPVSQPVRKPVQAQARTARKASGPARTLAAVSSPTKVHGYATVGVTWKSGTRLAEDQIAVQVRTQKDGVWSGWTTAAYHDEHGPDAGSAESRRIRPGTDAVVVGDVDAVQMRAETTDGQAPSDLELAVIDPGQTAEKKAPAAIDTAELPAADRDATSAAPIERTAGTGEEQSSGTAGDAALMAMKIAPKPVIYSRAQWGANENLRDKSSLRYGTVKTGFIHHTVNANDYTAAQVPALLRGIYAYHTQSRGWSDIGYNYLVDRFGRIWEGRYGGVDRAVVGAHTLGYNEYAFAMSAIGNFDVAQPPQALLDAYARLFAWKLSLYNIRADSTKLWVKDRYLQAINGHRDVGQTACPGRYLYAKIPAVRAAAQAIQNTGIVPTTPTTPTTPTPPTTPTTPTDPAAMVPLAAPAGTPEPTTAPGAAFRQPAITFPARRDLTGLPWADLVVKSASGAISIVPTGGIMGYDAPVSNAGPWAGMSLITALGDVTGDGKGDVLAKTAATGYARVFRGDGNGHVSSKGIGGTYAFKTANLIVSAGDFNRDGRRDVISRDRRTGKLMLHRGKGNGTFAPATVLRATWRYSYTAAADVNKDGRIDLLGLRPDNGLVLFPGKGGSTAKKAFGTPRVIAKLPGRVTGIAAGADATGDGLSDIALRYSTNLTALYAGSTTGALGAAWGPFTDAAGLGQLSGAQMAGSAAMDLVGKTTTGRLVVLPNNGRRNIGSRVATNLTIAGASQVLSVGDWDRDGKADVITREQAGNRLVLRPGLGGGKFGRGRSLGNGWSTITRLAAVGDVTGDGFPDLIGRIGTGPMLVFPGAGLQAFKAPVLAPASLRTFNQIGGPAWASQGATLASADGTFVPLAAGDPESALRAANGSTAATYDTYVGAGDVDGDGVADVLARQKGTGTIWLLPGKTSGGFGPRVWVADGYAGYQLIG
ncbi:FG-GAP-like repeat-containing protein [Marmoricola sp. RAF53]|uniref:FG-GAP-like repeat-containing protein n=1 Tax=Marmoricola sp. RAF53 TaxID=3233059 RepID=UPI003F96753E